MKLTKRIVAIAATAVMAMTSMVGMGASASDTVDSVNSINDINNILKVGLYIPKAFPTDFIQITKESSYQNGETTQGKCNMYNVITDDKILLRANDVSIYAGGIYGGQRTFYATTSGNHMIYDANKKEWVISADVKVVSGTNGSKSLTTRSDNVTYELQ